MSQNEGVPSDPPPRYDALPPPPDHTVATRSYGEASSRPKSKSDESEVPFQFAEQSATEGMRSDDTTPFSSGEPTTLTLDEHCVATGKATRKFEKKYKGGMFGVRVGEFTISRVPLQGN